MIRVVHALPGSGKTTFAAERNARREFPLWLDTDVILMSSPLDTCAGTEFWSCWKRLLDEGGDVERYYEYVAEFASEWLDIGGGIVTNLHQIVPDLPCAAAEVLDVGRTPYEMLRERIGNPDGRIVSQHVMWAVNWESLNITVGGEQVRRERLSAGEYLSGIHTDFVRDYFPISSTFFDDTMALQRTIDSRVRR